MVGVSFAIFFGIVWMFSPAKVIKDDVLAKPMTTFVYGVLLQSSVVVMLAYNGNWIAASTLMLGVAMYSATYLERKETPA